MLALPKYSRLEADTLAAHHQTQSRPVHALRCARMSSVGHAGIPAETCRVESEAVDGLLMSGGRIEAFLPPAEGTSRRLSSRLTYSRNAMLSANCSFHLDFPCVCHQTLHAACSMLTWRRGTCAQVQRGLVDGNNLRLALQLMLTAIKEQSPKMVTFGTNALLACQERLATLPQICQAVLQVSALDLPLFPLSGLVICSTLCGAAFFVMHSKPCELRPQL